MTTAASLSLASAEPQEQISNLRAAFATLTISAAARYTEVVGSTMADAFYFAVNDVAQTNAWEVQVAAGRVTDTHAFETPETAARAYRILARTIINHMGMVVGGRLANALMREVIQQLGPAQRQAVQLYHLVPDNILPGPAR